MSSLILLNSSYSLGKLWGIMYVIAFVILLGINYIFVESEDQTKFSI